MWRDAEEAFEKGKKLAEAGKFEDAIKEFDDVLKVNPRHKQAYNEKGKALLALGKVNSAVQFFTFATMVDPDFAQAWENLEAAQLVRDKPDLALKCIDQLLRIRSDDVNALLRKGRLLAKLGKCEEAAKNFVRAIALQPEVERSLVDDEKKILLEYSALQRPAPKQLIQKICLLGDPGVGKTSLIRRYVYDFFDDRYLITLGAKITKKVLHIGADIELTLMIWDIAGETDLKRVQRVYLQGTKGALLVCDVTRKATLENLSDWVAVLEDIAGEVPLVFLANKYDLKERVTFTEEDFAALARGFTAKYLFTSAKTGENVEDAFVSLGMALADAAAASEESA
jgi:small GTP-binding protein